MSLDTLGNIWIVTQNNGVAIFNPDTISGYNCMDKNLQMCSVVTPVTEFNHESENNITSYPNPFSTAIALKFNLSKTDKIVISVTDVFGKQIKNVAVEQGIAGMNKIEVDLSELNSGIYFCNLQTNEKEQVIKLIKN